MSLRTPSHRDAQHDGPSNYSAPDFHIKPPFIDTDARHLEAAFRRSSGRPCSSKPLRGSFVCRCPEPVLWSSFTCLRPDTPAVGIAAFRKHVQADIDLPEFLGAEGSAESGLHPLPNQALSLNDVLVAQFGKNDAHYLILNVPASLVDIPCAVAQGTGHLVLHGVGAPISVGSQALYIQKHEYEGAAGTL